MKRFQDWPTRMDQWISAHAQDAHLYGTWDCALMACAHSDNIRGTSLYAEHAGKCTEETVTEYLATLAPGTLPDVWSAITGLQPMQNPKLAQRGDVVSFDTDLGPALGVVDLSGQKILALHPLKTGFTRLPLKLATAAWRV